MIKKTISIILGIILLLGGVLINNHVQRQISDSYSAGYSDGEEAGYQRGYNSGKADGFSAGEEAGYNSGYYAGIAGVSRSANNYNDTYGSGDYYIGNAKSGVFHDSDCSYLPDSKNQVIISSREEAISQGYRPCGHCNP